MLQDERQPWQAKLAPPHSATDDFSEAGDVAGTLWLERPKDAGLDGTSCGCSLPGIGHQPLPCHFSGDPSTRYIDRVAKEGLEDLPH
jgi:hypothetical protein